MDGNQLCDLLQVGSALTMRLAKLVGKRTVFCGSGPFSAAVLANLHPDKQLSFVADEDDYDVLELAAEEQIDVVVLGEDWCDYDGLEIVLEECSEDALVLSQAGFLALAIFEQDWWNGARQGLPGRGDMMAPFPMVESILKHGGVLEWTVLVSDPDNCDAADEDTEHCGGGLDDEAPEEHGEAPEDDDDYEDDDEFDPELVDYGESVDDVFAALPPDLPNELGSALDAAAYEPTGSEVRFRESTIIRGKYGYQIGERTAQERWAALVRAVLGEGLRLVAEELAGLPRARRLQRGGREKYRQAIESWEHDLAKLKTVYYQGDFPWPSTEPSVRRQQPAEPHHWRPSGISYARR